MFPSFFKLSVIDKFTLMQLAFSRGLQINIIQLIVNSIMLVSFYQGVLVTKKI